MTATVVPTSLMQNGQTVYNSWGCEQTNIDFYEIVRMTGHYIWLKRLNAHTTETGFMCGPTEPILGSYDARQSVTKHKVDASDGRPYITFKHGTGRVWEGRPMQCSWYG